MLRSSGGRRRNGIGRSACVYEQLRARSLYTTYRLKSYLLHLVQFTVRLTWLQILLRIAVLVEYRLKVSIHILGPFQRSSSRALLRLENEVVETAPLCHLLPVARERFRAIVCG